MVVINVVVIKQCLKYQRGRSERRLKARFDSGRLQNVFHLEPGYAV